MCIFGDSRLSQSDCLNQKLQQSFIPGCNTGELPDKAFMVTCLEFRFFGQKGCCQFTGEDAGPDQKSKFSLGLKVILTSSNTSKSMSLWLCHIYHIHIFKTSWKNWKDSAFKAFQNHSDCSVIPSATMTLQGSLCCHLSTTPGCSKCLALSRISSPEFRHIVSNASKCRCIGINDIMQRCF